jgi:hypothetical protein
LQTNKIIDNDNNIFVTNPALNIFAKIDTNGNKTDFHLQGSYAVDSYCFNDTNVNNAIKKNNNVRTLFLDELNARLLIQGLIYNVSPTHSFLCVQIYTKDGEFINEHIYKLKTDNILSFNYSCIYNKNLAFILRNEECYNLVFIPIE